MHYSDSRSKTTIFIEKLIENLFQKVVPCFYESFNAILLNNMRLFLHKKAISYLLLTHQISKMADPAEVAKCMMG